MTNDADATLPRQLMSDDAGLRDAAAATGGLAFEGSAEFARVLRTAMAHASEHATRRLCWCDENFGAWPIGEAEWLESLTRWSRVGGRELVMIARDWSVVERRHPRFATWRRDWTHVIRCLVPEETRTEALPTLWIDSGDQAVRVFDTDHWRGRAGFDRVDRQRAREDFDAIAQRAAPGFASTTLGL